MIVANYLGLHLDLFQRIEIAPASLTILAMGASRPALIQLNETSYLPKSEKEILKQNTDKPEVGKSSVEADQQAQQEGQKKA
jgi:hypothetical protein